MIKKDLVKRIGICVGVLAVAAVALGSTEETGEQIAEVYTVRPNDTIWTISETFLPEGKYILQYQYELLEANPDVKANGCRIHPGDKIKIVR